MKNSLTIASWLIGFAVLSMSALASANCDAPLAFGTFNERKTSITKDDARNFFNSYQSFKSQSSNNSTSGGGSLGLDVFDLFKFSGGQNNSSDGNSTLLSDLSSMTVEDFSSKYTGSESLKIVSDKLMDNWLECKKLFGVQIAKTFTDENEIAVEVNFISPMQGGLPLVMTFDGGKSLKCGDSQKVTIKLQSPATRTVRCIRVGNGNGILTIEQSNYYLTDAQKVFRLQEKAKPPKLVGSLAGKVKAVAASGTIPISVDFTGVKLYDNFSASGGYLYTGEGNNYSGQVVCWRRLGDYLIVGGPLGFFQGKRFSDWNSFELQTNGATRILSVRAGGGANAKSVCNDPPALTNDAKALLEDQEAVQMVLPKIN